MQMLEPGIHAWTEKDFDSFCSDLRASSRAWGIVLVKRPHASEATAMIKKQ